MNNAHTPEQSVTLDEIRALWQQTASNSKLFTADGAWEVEGYWRTTACSVGLRLTAMSKILETTEADANLRNHVQKLSKECELLNAITNFLLDQLPRPRP